MPTFPLAVPDGGGIPKRCNISNKASSDSGRLRWSRHNLDLVHIIIIVVVIVVDFSWFGLVHHAVADISFTLSIMSFRHR